MTAMEIFVWALAGGLLVTMLSAAAVLFNKETPSNKQLSRDFLIGAAFTGFVYPLIPDTFNDVKGAITTTATSAIAATASAVSSGSIDPDVKIGPANF
jgi:hypothetical protein